LTWEEYKKLLKEKGIELKPENEADIKSAFEKIGASAFEAKKAELEAELKKKLEAAAKPSATPSTEDNDTILALKAEVKSLTDLLGEMKKDRDASLEAQKEKLAKDREKKIEEFKKKGLSEGKITEANWTEKWKAIAEKDPDQFETILSGLAVDPTFKKDSKPGEKPNIQSSYRGPLSGADPAMLEAMTKMDN
jgi:hypothetical protein